MPWDEKHQVAATQRFFEFMEEFNTKFGAWTGALQSGANAAAGQSAVEDVLRRWRGHLEGLRAESEGVLNNTAMVTSMEQLVAQVAEEQATLQSLKSQAITREDQADSVNPKVRESPWTNLLGLDRVFRPNTRRNILIASVVFGVFAVFAIGFLIYRVLTNPAGAVPMSYTVDTGSGVQQLGGRRR